MKLFVAGLPYDLDDAELEEIFEKFGTIKSAKVAIDKDWESRIYRKRQKAKSLSTLRNVLH